VKQLALETTRLELRPLPSAAARALPEDRETAARLLGAAISADWPQPDLLDVLPMQAAAAAGGERFGVWVIIERASATVVGDLGFMGPPGEDGGVEIGYCVVPDRRGRGYASEAVAALVAWALAQPGVASVAARCDVVNVPSIRVLERASFLRSSESDGQIRWLLEASSLRA